MTTAFMKLYFILRKYVGSGSTFKRENVFSPENGWSTRVLIVFIFSADSWLYLILVLLMLSFIVD